MRIVRSIDVQAYAAPTIEAVLLNVERGFATSFPDGGIEPMSMDYSSDGDIIVEE